mmetsp:Transcript_122957/g.244640  ORF Transcript_122957/g.244640 Transcript_122957/m.244640 type:complete len:311 (+) Transcript_122957:793-1725(+)
MPAYLPQKYLVVSSFPRQAPLWLDHQGRDTLQALQLREQCQQLSYARNQQQLAGTSFEQASRSQRQLVCFAVPLLLPPSQACQASCCGEACQARCSEAWHAACPRACWMACHVACLVAYLMACLACPLGRCGACPEVSLLACLMACLVACLMAWRVPCPTACPMPCPMACPMACLAAYLVADLMDSPTDNPTAYPMAYLMERLVAHQKPSQTLLVACPEIQEAFQGAASRSLTAGLDSLASLTFHESCCHLLTQQLETDHWPCLAKRAEASQHQSRLLSQAVALLQLPHLVHLRHIACGPSHPQPRPHQK